MSIIKTISTAFVEKASFLTLKAKLVFTQLRQAFTKALIFQHFYSECYIWIETKTSFYAFSNILSQLASNFDQ